MWWAIAIAGVALGLAWIDGESGLRPWWALRADLERTEARIEALRLEVVSLEAQTGDLQDDPFLVERAIREGLEYARPGETIVRLAPRGAANARIP